MHRGHCLCGAVRFEVTGDLAPIEVCHCSQCRRAQGGPVGTNIPVARSHFQLTSGEHRLKSFESSPGKRRIFCGDCGSPVYSERGSVPGMVRLRAGLLDGPVRTRLAHQAFVGSKAGWWPLIDELPRHEAGHAPSSGP
jgi:hypothetical protein